MTKINIYRLAQVAIMESDFLTDDQKLVILRELMDREDMEVLLEQRREEKA